jgi:hypothetical protein
MIGNSLGSSIHPLQGLSCAHGFFTIDLTSASSYLRVHLPVSRFYGLRTTSTYSLSNQLSNCEPRSGDIIRSLPIIRDKHVNRPAV